MRSYAIAALTCLGAGFGVMPSQGQPTVKWRAVVSPAGSIRVERKGRDFGTLDPGLFEATWQGASLSPGRPGAGTEGNVARGTIRAPGGAVVDSELRIRPQAQGLALAYRLTPRSEVKLNSLHVAFSIPATMLAGGSYVADEQRGGFPVAFDKPGLRSAPTSTLGVTCTDGSRLGLRFAKPTPVLIQDDRQWSPSFTIRIGPQMDGTAPWPAGKTQEIEFVLTAEGGIGMEQDGPVAIQAGADWLPLDVQLDVEPGSALDLSKAFAWHTPAGKFGRVVADGDHMVLADKPVRFYGFNLCFTAQYLPHEDAERLAERLYRLGYNAVRIHHYESTLVDRSQGSSTRLNPEMLDRLDYLFAALKKRGIYTTTDLFVSRPVFNNEIWPGTSGDVGMDEFKMAVPANDRAFANYKAFATALLGHVNPYTNLKWADDPALAWLSLINEPNPGNFVGQLKEPLLEDYRRAWTRWYDSQHPGRTSTDLLPLPAQNEESTQWTEFNVFLADNQASFYQRAKDFLRNELHCGAMLTNLNSWTNPAQMEAIRKSFDYVDDHFYVDHPQFIERPWALPSRCDNSSPVSQGAPGGRSCAMIRVLGKPFTCTEFNYAGPGRFRGVGGILTGALGAIQDWAGIWRFDYSGGRENLFNPSPIGYFDLVTDPLNQAADRASLLLFRRGDMKPAPHSVALGVTAADALRNPRNANGVVPGWNMLAWVTKVGSVVPDDPSKPAADLVLPLAWGTPPSDYGAKALAGNAYASDAADRILAAMRERGWLNAQNTIDVKTNRFQSETGELTIDAPDDRLTIDTDRTAGGYAAAGEKIQTKAVTVQVQDTDATVWVSSVDGQPISTSKRMVITHLTDLQNTGIRYGDRARRVLLDWGGLPHLVRKGRATVTIHVANPEKARVWGLEINGKRTASVPARVENGALVIPLTVDAAGKARMLYEVEVD